MSTSASAVRLGTPYEIDQPVGIMGELTVITGNSTRCSTNVNAVQDVAWNHTVYQCPAGAFGDAGTSWVIV